MTTSRIADISLSQNSIQNLQASLSQIADLQNEASSGKKLTKPSDSPVDIGPSLQLRAWPEPQHAAGDATSATPKAGSGRPTPRSARS